MSHVVRVRKDRVRRVKDFLLKNRGFRELRTTNPYEDFRLQYEDGVVVGYVSGKIVATGERNWRALSQAIFEMEPGAGEQVVIGSDEAGKGEWLGPLVVATVGLSPEESRKLRSIGVMDSKLLSLPRISELASGIRGNSLSFRIVSVPPSRFNELMLDVRDEGKTLNDLLAWAHSVAVRYVVERAMGLGKKVRIVIDEFDRIRTEERLRRVIDLSRFQVSQYPRAEEEEAVAAASILARDGRERWIDSEGLRVGENLRKLSIEDALKRDDSFSFAKLAYLKLGKSEVEAERSRALQHMIAIEHSLRQLAPIWGLSSRTSTTEIVAAIRKKGILPSSTVNSLTYLLETRDRIAHDRLELSKEIFSASEAAGTISRQLRRLVKSVEKSEEWKGMTMVR